VPYSSKPKRSHHKIGTVCETKKLRPEAAEGSNASAGMPPRVQQNSCLRVRIHRSEGRTEYFKIEQERTVSRMVALHSAPLAGGAGPSKVAEEASPDVFLSRPRYDVRPDAPGLHSNVSSPLAGWSPIVSPQCCDLRFHKQHGSEYPLAGRWASAVRKLFDL